MPNQSRYCAIRFLRAYLVPALVYCSAALSSVLFVAVASSAIYAQGAPESKNIELVSHLDLDPSGDGGEAMAIQQYPDGRRVLYFVHQAMEMCLSVIDVTHPENPKVMTRLAVPNPGHTHCNSVALSGNTLLVANSADKPGEKPAGMWVLDISDLSRVIQAKNLQDLEVSFFDTSGPHSRGVHTVWFVDGEFAHLSTGMPDSNSTSARDDQFYVVVDLRDSHHPHEVGRWWLPGTQASDACLPGCLPKRYKFDGGFRAHNIQVYPERPDRAYVGYLEAGSIVLDITGLADVRSGHAENFTPKLISRTTVAPAYPSNTHTFQPVFSRGLAWSADEANETVPEKCLNSPKSLWLLDIRSETNPIIIGTAPLPENSSELCKRGGRFGAFNIHPNLPSTTSAKLVNTVVATFFSGGLRIFRLTDFPGIGSVPPRILEIGYFIPPAPPKSPSGTSQLAFPYVDEHGLIYVNDLRSGGLYILKYTGKEPLD
jgi:hypothetical protein